MSNGNGYSGKEASRMNEDYKYYNHPLLLVPYTPDIPGTSSDVCMMEAYRRMHDEGLYEIVFHDNPTLTLGRYMAWFNSPHVLAQFVYKYNDDASTEDMAGMIWLSNIEQCGNVGRGAASFVVFRDHQDGVTPVAIAKLGLKYWFEGLGVDIVTGTTPILNRAATAFIHRIGMKQIGVIPKYANYRGKVSDALITYVDKDTYSAKSKA